jgi:anti-sigma regulatory factor (Ser/Thr protein kinase)
MATADATTREAVVRLPAAVTSPRHARRFVRDHLVAWGMPGLTDSVELMVSELVTNAIVHARSDARLVARQNGPTLRIEVEDWGDGAPVLREPGPECPSGRGLRFVDALSDAWGATATANGKCVWFELPCETTAPSRR